MSRVLLSKVRVESTIYVSQWDTVTRTVQHTTNNNSGSVTPYEIPVGTPVDEYCSGTTLVKVTGGPTLKALNGVWYGSVRYENQPNSTSCGYVSPNPGGGNNNDNEFQDVPEDFLEQSGLTMSYQIDLKSWTGEHSYHPNWIVSNGTKMYLSKEDSSSIHRHNVGDYGVYLSKPKVDMEIELVVNKFPLDTKSFDNFVIYTDSEDEHDTFKTIQVFNNRQNSDELTIFVPKSFTELTTEQEITTLILQKVSNEFRCVVPPDLVNDSKGDIFTSSNLVSSNSFSDEDRMFRPRMKGKFIVVRLTYDNNQYFQFFTIKTNFRGIAR